MAAEISTNFWYINHITELGYTERLKPSKFPFEF
jgi:hypothetical protein